MPRASAAAAEAPLTEAAPTEEEPTEEATAAATAVPEKVSGYATYQREQPKTNKERLARRYAKRHNLDYETALNGIINLNAPSPDQDGYKTQFRYCDMPQKNIPTPFIRLKSLSSEQTFCLWIKKTVVAEPAGTTFSSYGLSATSTVPEF